MSIQVEVFGDAFPQRSSTFDIYRPQLVRFEHFDDTNDNGLGIVEHIDVVATWKGISHEQAIELIFWEKAFQKSLESLIEETLISDFFLVDHDAASQTLSEAEILFRMHQYVNSFGHKEFCFPLKSMVEFMLEYHEAYGRHCTWFQGTGNIYNLVADFLRTKDCFVQHQESCCSVEVLLSTSLQPVPSKQAYSRLSSPRRSLESGFSGQGQVLRIIADLISSPHHLSYAISADNKIRYLFEPPLLDLACHPLPYAINISSFGWETRNVAVTVTRRFPGHVKFELAFRLNVRDGLMSTGSEPPRSIPSNSSHVAPRSSDSGRSAKNSLPDDRMTSDVTPSRPFHAGTIGSRSHYRSRHSPLDRRMDRQLWTEPAMSELEHDARTMHPRLYETYGDARIRKYDTLPARKPWESIESYSFHGPDEITPHFLPRWRGSWCERNRARQIGQPVQRPVSFHPVDDGERMPIFNRHMARMRATFPVEFFEEAPGQETADCGDMENFPFPNPPRGGAGVDVLPQKRPMRSRSRIDPLARYCANLQRETLITSPRWQSPRKPRRVQPTRIVDNSSLRSRNIYDVLASSLSKGSSTSDKFPDGSHPRRAVDMVDESAQTVVQGSKHDSSSTFTEHGTVKSVGNVEASSTTLSEKAKGKRRAVEAIDDRSVASTASTRAKLTEAFELEVDWDKYGTLGLRTPPQRENNPVDNTTTDYNWTHSFDADIDCSGSDTATEDPAGDSVLLPERTRAGISALPHEPHRAITPTPSPHCRRCDTPTPTPPPTSLRKRSSKRTNTPLHLEALADAQQAQIQANFNEFLAKAEEKYGARVIGAAQDPETKAFEAIFMGSPVSEGTAEICVSGTEGEGMEICWGDGAGKQEGGEDAWEGEGNQGDCEDRGSGWDYGNQGAQDTQDDDAWETDGAEGAGGETEELVWD